MAVEQHILEQLGCSSSLDPTHLIITTLLALNPFSEIISPRSVCLMTFGFFPKRYSAGSYSTAPVATTTVPCLTFSPLLSVDSKLPMYPLTSATVSFRCTL